MNVSKYAKTYAMASQGIFSMAILGILGFFIGRWIDKDSVWPAILAVLGVLLGLFTLVGNLLYILNQEEKAKKKAKEEKEQEVKESIDEKVNKEE